MAKLPEVDIIDFTKKRVTLQVQCKLTRVREWNVRVWITITLLHITIWFIGLIAPFNINITNEDSDSEHNSGNPNS